MSANPYENEPGFEDANESHDKKNQKGVILISKDALPHIQHFLVTDTGYGPDVVVARVLLTKKTCHTFPNPIKAQDSSIPRMLGMQSRLYVGSTVEALLLRDYQYKDKISDEEMDQIIPKRES